MKPIPFKAYSLKGDPQAIFVKCPEIYDDGVHLAFSRFARSRQSMVMLDPEDLKGLKMLHNRKSRECIEREKSACDFAKKYKDKLKFMSINGKDYAVIEGVGRFEIEVEKE